MRGLALRPLVKTRGINDDLAVRREFDLGPVHGTRGRPFEINSLTVVSAAVAGTFKFIFRWLPVRGATQMGAARVDHEEPVWSAIDPYAVLLLKLGVDAEGELGGVSDFENCVGFEKSAGKKETEEGQEPGCEKGSDADPDQAPPAAIDIGVRGSGIGNAAGRGRLGSAHGGGPDVFRGVGRGPGCGRRRR